MATARAARALSCVQELRKQVGWSATQPALYFHRTAAGREVDIVLEDRQRRLVGIEVKAGATIGHAHWKGLEDLQAVAGTRFLRGVLLYEANVSILVGSRKFAAAGSGGRPMFGNNLVP